MVLPEFTVATNVATKEVYMKAAHGGFTNRACKIFADHRLLDQVFTNLLSNAVKYSPDSPLIEVKGWNDEENALITVTDQGVGIPANDLPHMFGQFFRAKTSEGIKGTGIGLNVVKEFVEMHGGSVGVDSLEGEGSTFTVRIPIGGEDQ